MSGTHPLAAGSPKKGRPLRKKSTLSLQPLLKATPNYSYTLIFSPPPHKKKLASMVVSGGRENRIPQTVYSTKDLEQLKAAICSGDMRSNICFVTIAVRRIAAGVRCLFSSFLTPSP